MRPTKKSFIFTMENCWGDELIVRVQTKKSIAAQRLYDEWIEFLIRTAI